MAAHLSAEGRESREQRHLLDPNVLAGEYPWVTLPLCCGQSCYGGNTSTPLMLRLQCYRT
jgi:hypothetical protein